jgi:thiol-disulfide isomerase/thioredoxin
MRRLFCCLCWQSRAAVIAVGLVCGAAVCRPAAAQSAGVADPPGAALHTVPPLPQGTPEELMKFVECLQAPPQQKSREEMRASMQGVAKVSVQAADAILGQVKPGERFYAEAARLKLESLMKLWHLGVEGAEADIRGYATTLVDCHDPLLAREARRRLIVWDKRSSVDAGKLDAAPGLVNRVAELLAADPDDTQTAMLAMQLANGFLRFEGGETHAAAAYATFGPLFARSGDAEIRAKAESFASIVRRLSLPGKPMEIRGTLLGGEDFDQKSLAGKVVLVSFWATSCGPCVEKMPHILALYEKYHATGIEVDALVELIGALDQRSASGRPPLPRFWVRLLADRRPR